MSDETNPLNHIMNLLPLEMPPKDLDDVIAYIRRLKTDYDVGIKPKKGDPNVGGVELLQKIGMVTKPSAIKRRV